MHRLLVPTFLGLAACAPMQADVAGTYTAWLASDSSPTVDKLLSDKGELPFSNASSVEPFDCATVECEDLDLDHFDFLTDSPFYIVQGDLAPWRSEAILTSEGDLQISFHVDLGHGNDFRVEMVVDPRFEPKECTTNASGETELVAVDGGDWVEEWSADESPLHIFYLNAGAYQINPYDADEYWSLPQEWLSGFGHAKFAEEEFYSHPSDYGVYDLADSLDEYENEVESWYYALDADTPDWTSYDLYASQIRARADAWTEELITQGHAQEDFALKVEDNRWRTLDSSQAGLDSWVQMDSSWVRLDKRGELVEGDAVSGDFQVLFDGVEAQSKVLVTGTFSVESISVDRWGYPNLDEEMREENNTPTCE